jgi:peptidoglycan/xylan/chitin deacetylase (PgdA/CDA1 family)
LVVAVAAASTVGAVVETSAKKTPTSTAPVAPTGTRATSAPDSTTTSSVAAPRPTTNARLYVDPTTTRPSRTSQPPHAADAASSTGGANFKPAFYTDQAPGGAATAGQKVIALTFDDGPGPQTPQVLAVLQKYHVAATFFDIGRNAAAYPQYVQMVAHAGYPVEDHTWSHPDLTTVAPSQFPYQIDQTQTEVQKLTGITPTCVRPPYNAWNQAALDQIGQRGLTTMSYSVDPKDWTNPGSAAIVARVVGAAFPGAVVDMHDAGGPRTETIQALPGIITQLKAKGYTFVSICGSNHHSAVYAYGSVASAIGQLPAGDDASPTAYTGFARTADGKGFWTTTADGRVFGHGDAKTYGSLAAFHLVKPIVGMAATSDGKGYWLVASDGGIFSFGDAHFHGSTGGVHLVKPIVGMAATSDGNGYWLIASDGGIFSFGDAHFHGSTGGVHLDKPIVGIAPTTDNDGYWLAASDGGIFSFGDAHFRGSGSGTGIPGQTFYAIASAPTGSGYFLAGQHL